MNRLEVGRRKAAEFNADVVREFVHGGISGRSDHRKAFQDALAFFRLNRVDYLIG